VVVTSNIRKVYVRCTWSCVILKEILIISKHCTNRLDSVTDTDHVAWRGEVLVCFLVSFVHLKAFWNTYVTERQALLCSVLLMKWQCRQANCKICVPCRVTHCSTVCLRAPDLVCAGVAAVVTGQVSELQEKKVRYCCYVWSASITKIGIGT
jgi:hypothetical protein